MNIEIPETGEYTIGSGDVGIVRAGSPTVHVAGGGRCLASDSSTPKIIEEGTML